jgi:hypothetical protein
MSYNLLEEDWIPVLWKTGKLTRVNLIQALTEAHCIRQIAATNPMDRVATLRFLLALLYWCVGDPPRDPTSGGTFSEAWFTKLCKNKECFNLLGDGNRFYQYRPDSGKDKKLSVNYLIHEVPTGSNVRHFRHSGDGVNGLCRACCATGLLRLPVFTTQGGQGKSPGINGKPPVYVIPLGQSLCETLWLSWRPESNLGTPAWEKPDIALPKTGEVPLLTGLTWLPRRVWLDNPMKPEVPCICCGRKELLIRHCIFAGIGSGKADGRVWNDPHVVRDNNVVMTPSNALADSDTAAGDWAKITAAILSDTKHTSRHRFWVVGFASKQDKYLEAKEFEIFLRLTTESAQIQDAIKEIERWQSGAAGLAKRVVRVVKNKKSSRKHVEIDALVNAIRPHIEASASVKLNSLISDGHPAWEGAANYYEGMMVAISRSISSDFTATALRQRQEIARVKPDMRLKTEKARKSDRRRGDK